MIGLWPELPTLQEFMGIALEWDSAMGRDDIP